MATATATATATVNVMRWRFTPYEIRLDDPNPSISFDTFRIGIATTPMGATPRAARAHIPAQFTALEYSQTFTVP
jgi:hypothetical protein